LEKDPGARVWAGAKGVVGAGRVVKVKAVVKVMAVGEVWAAEAGAKAVVRAGWAVRWRQGREGIVYAPTAGNRLGTLSGGHVIG